MPQIYIIAVVVAYLTLLTVYTEGLLNPLAFKKWNRMSCTRTRNVLFQQTESEAKGGYGDSDEDLFIALLNEKQLQEGAADTHKTPTSDHKGAGVPRPSLGPEDVVPLLMTALKNNDIPEVDAGLVSMWEFASDITKYVFNNNITGKYTYV
jgi:hypothetical protein